VGVVQLSDYNAEVPKGWRTQFLETITPNTIADREGKDVFFGLGNCPPEATNPSPDDDIGIALITLLRQGCNPRHKVIVHALQSEGHIEINNNTITFATSSKLL
jgi:hypothetical protein